jgi:hypothetical protein
MLSTDGPLSGDTRLDPVWVAALGTAHRSKLQSREQVKTLAKSFNGRVGCSDSATWGRARSHSGRGRVSGQQGRAGSLKKQRARTSRQQWAGGHYMMEQADSGFRTWQVHAAPQYCRKVW